MSKVFLDTTNVTDELVFYCGNGREIALLKAQIIGLQDDHLPFAGPKPKDVRTKVLIHAEKVEERLHVPPPDERIPYKLTDAGRAALAETEPTTTDEATTIASLQDQLATAIAVNTAIHKLLQSCQGVDPQAERARVQFLQSKESLAELWTALGAVLTQVVEASEGELNDLTLALRVTGDHIPDPSRERWSGLPDTVRAVHLAVENIEEREHERELEILANNSAAAASE